jgi:hypothetical protein
VIGRLRGTLAEKQPPHLILDVNGLGYELEVPMTTLYRLPSVGEPLTLHTPLVVREDAHILYGFATLEERAAFRQLIRISGIGARKLEAYGEDIVGLVRGVLTTTEFARRFGTALPDGQYLRIHGNLVTGQEPYGRDRCPSYGRHRGRGC